MADLKNKTESQIQAEMLSILIAQLGLNDINAGSVLDVLTQAAAQQDFAQYYAIAQVSRLVDLDRTFGEDLDNKAFEYGLTRRDALKATGLINILKPESFEKVDTSFFAGFPAASNGDTTISVNDASNVLFSTSGTLVIGRGTNAEEEVSYSVAPTNNVNYWSIALDTPIQNDHTQDSSIILKQDTDITINAGTVVSVPATGVSVETQFIVQNDAILLAGEDKVENVEVIAAVPGSAGNIPAKAINGEAFPTPPFTGARAQNIVKFTTGRNRETDAELRDRIKSTIQSLSKGVKEAILNAIVGLVDPDTAKRVVSASVVLPVEEAGDVKVYIDDGTGFEPSFSQQAFETIRQNASPGETRLQLDNFPVMKASVETKESENYDFSNAPLSLNIQVGLATETVELTLSDFAFPSQAKAEEVVTAINNKSNLVEARTGNNGTTIVLTSKAEINEEIQILGGTANVVLAFPTDKRETISLFKNDIAISKDGSTAFIDSGNEAPFDLDAIGAFPQTLALVIDGKTVNPQTVTFQAADFVDTSQATSAEVAAVINAQLSGAEATAINDGAKVRIASKTLFSTESKVNVTGGTANDATDGFDFSTIEVTGLNKDYIFNRELGIIELTDPLVGGDVITAGSQFTRGRALATTPENYAPADATTLVISIDGGADQTITFDATFATGRTAQETADFINLTLQGGSARVREIGTDKFLEINTNTYDATGTIQIQASSTAIATFGFDSNVHTSAEATRAFVESTTAPFAFRKNDNLIIQLDKTSTFAVPLTFASEVTAATDPGDFTASTLSATFPTADLISDFHIAFLTGANSTTGTISTITNPSGDDFEYTFDVTPTNWGDFAIGDLITFQSFDDLDNNGSFVIKNIVGDIVTVENPSGVAAAAQAGGATASIKRIVDTYNHLTGNITTTVDFPQTVANTDEFILLPVTLDNVVSFMNNKKVTSLSTKASIEKAKTSTVVQISSLEDGSDGTVQVTGGAANEVLEFSTTAATGLEGYNYFTGLAELVHRTIYGDDTDLVAFPGIGAAGITFRVLAPTTNEVTVNINVTLREGISLPSVDNEIKSKIASYINTLGVGEDLIIEEIRSAVIRISGILDVTLTSPTVNITAEDNEVIRIKDSDILIG